MQSEPQHNDSVVVEADAVTSPTIPSYVNLQQVGKTKKIRFKKTGCDLQTLKYQDSVKGQVSVKGPVAENSREFTAW